MLTAPRWNLPARTARLVAVASLALVLVKPSLAVSLTAQTAPVSEYQLKAAFLFHFAQFVEWPPAAFADSQAPFVLGILGDDPFGPLLDETIKDETVNGRTFRVERYPSIDEVNPCHILYVSPSEQDRLEEILGWLRDRSTLTVGDGEGFTRHGGIIRFLTQRNRVRFRVNVVAARAAQLTISSKLLRAADVVGDD